MDKQEIRDQLIKVGVTVLKEYGYPEVTVENILTDQIYKAFYKQILIDNLGFNEVIDEVVQDLLEEIK